MKQSNIYDFVPEPTEPAKLNKLTVMRIKAERREKKRQKKKNMKVDGASVKNLQKMKVEWPEKLHSK